MPEKAFEVVDLGEFTATEIDMPVPSVPDRMVGADKADVFKSKGYTVQVGRGDGTYLWVTRDSDGKEMLVTVEKKK